ncbi:MAG: transporter substrate-binding domain-containing protein [Terrimicrobiaceae bacterium]|nr:transporter substrate-binding domain-containing protein [Terrimicrobiaceae bacterium]
MRAALLLVLLASVTWASAAESLRVGIHDKPPYAVKKEDGTWEGLAVDLWTEIATRTGITYSFVELPFDQLLTGLTDGRIDAAVGEVAVNSERARSVDFTQPYLDTSVGVVVRANSWHPDWSGLAADFLNWTLVQVLLAIVAGMFVVSLIIWWLERHHHVGHFRGGLHGFGSALWFTAVTMTTVGYGDKTPSTFSGRIVSFFWMLVGVLLIGAFTAAVASTVAAAKVNESVTSAGDLRRLVAGVMSGSDAQQILVENGVPGRPFPTIEDALAALADKRVDAVVADRTSLTWLMQHHDSFAGEFRLTPIQLRQTFLAIPMRRGLEPADAINLALLDAVSSPEWRASLRRWLGPESAN